MANGSSSLNARSGTLLEPPRGASETAAYEAGKTIGELIVWAILIFSCCTIVSVPLLVVRWRQRRQEERERREAEERARQAWIAQQEHARAMALQTERERQMFEAARQEQARQMEAARQQQERQIEEERRRIQAVLDRQAREQEEQARRGEEETRRVKAEKIRADEEAKQAAERQRRDSLIQRFGEQDAAKIIRGELWLGATAEMLIESLGNPADSEKKVLKTKTKEVWKYYPAGANRYKLRVTLENGVVVGWEDKS